MVNVGRAPLRVGELTLKKGEYEVVKAGKFVPAALGDLEKK